MMQLERQKKILDYLNKNRKATTKELSQLLDGKILLQKHMAVPYIMIEALITLN